MRILIQVFLLFPVLLLASYTLSRLLRYLRDKLWRRQLYFYSVATQNRTFICQLNIQAIYNHLSARFHQFLFRENNICNEEASEQSMTYLCSAIKEPSSIFHSPCSNKNNAALILKNRSPSRKGMSLVL